MQVCERTTTTKVMMSACQNSRIYLQYHFFTLMSFHPKRVQLYSKPKPVNFDLFFLETYVACEIHNRHSDLI